MLLLLTLAGCPKKTPEVDIVKTDPLEKRPEVPAAQTFTPPEAEVLTLDNGAALWVLHKPGLPLVTIELVADGGKAADDIAGTSRLCDKMMLRGAGERDATAFAAVLDQQAIDLTVGTYDTSSMMTLSTHAGRLSTGLELMADAVLKPNLSAEEFDKLLAQTKASLDEDLARPPVVASWVASRIYWGEGHPLATPAIGTKASLEEVTVEACAASLETRWKPDRSTFVVSGDLSAADAKAALDAAFADWSGPSEEVLDLPAAVTDPGFYLVDDPGATQSTLRVMAPGWHSVHPDRTAADLGAIVLGGTFTSRLNRLLREEKGYTYGARANLSYGAGYGHVIASSSVRADVTGLALQDLLGELDKINAGIDEAELEKAKGARRTSLMSRAETRSGVAGTWGWYAADGQPPTQMAEDLAAVEAASLESVNAALGSIDWSEAVVVVVGDLELVRPQLDEVVGDIEWTQVEK